MARTRPVAVQVDTALRLVVPDGSGVPVQATLRYEPSDPYAVHVIFCADLADGDEPEPSVAWSFARDLLLAGLTEPAGMGDVRVWPWTGQDGQVVALALSSPDGHALFEVPTATLDDFLQRSYAEVPAGEEAAYVDLDAVVTELLRA